MKPINILITAIAAPIVIIVTLIALILLYAHGPVPILRLTPYDEVQKRTTFPQWISNDEICYLELVLHRDKTVFEQGKFILFIKEPIMDIYIYREKIGQPETKKLIKHLARKHAHPIQSLEGSLDSNLGFRVYDNGKKIFLYYSHYYNSVVPDDYRYVTLDVTGRNMRERVPKIVPRDISQDGKKLYGIYWGNNAKYCITEYTLKDKKIKTLMDVTEGKFKRSRRGWIGDLKLVSENKLMFSYHTDVNMPEPTDYVYSIDISNGKSEMIEKIFDHHISGDYVHYSHHGYAISKDERYLIIGNIGIYEKKENGWTIIKDFYKEYPAISPDSRKIAYFDIVVKKGELGSLWFVGRKFAIEDLDKLLRN